ncbi:MULTISPECIES: sigma-54 dependent transcriptional regulator [unclassified Thioalkalivibrio]|uniref:sigma-54-dependent transcriptional regulator n=1 Tax=unclassified Thioalkalivibrio TaxID=2621013 RepID=UPI000366A011|nr:MULTISPECIES: sigma-54 dependent transcriptional regulator [unclassified Thioalkalivibrio]
MTRILLVDDEAPIRRAVRRFLEHHGFAVGVAENLAEARALAAADPYDLQLVDLRLPDGEGIELLPEFTRTPTVIMTSYASVPSAVTAMKEGAADYIAKPFDHDALLLTLRAALRERAERDRPTTEATDEDAEAPSHPGLGLVGESAVMQQLRDQIRRVAATHSTVLLRGESGTGKELAARALHELSPRASGPFVAVNCATIPEGLVEAELFGHAQGAYTGAVKARTGLIQSAHGGTLFLDEIGELAPAAQARLLRVLQDGEIRPVGANENLKVDVRLLAATHRDLETMIAEQTFRADLYYRLRVLELSIPPLRERREDILPLAQHFLENLPTSGPAPHLTPEAQEALGTHDWPGNVRELANALERGWVLSPDGHIAPEQMGLSTHYETTVDDDIPNPAFPTRRKGKGSSLNEYFRQFVQENQDRMTETELARALGISRKTLWERRQRENLPRPRS